MSELNSQRFKQVYDWLGINLSQLGCVMQPLKKFSKGGIDLPLYKSKNEDRFWINGWVADKKAHVTLLYGLLHKPHNIKPHVEKVLDGWSLKEVVIDRVSFFPSPYEDEKYWCIIAKIKPTPELLEAHQRLSFLPHINTFPQYNPHMTLCYIDHVSEQERDRIVMLLDNTFHDKTIPVEGDIDLGRQ